MALRNNDSKRAGLGMIDDQVPAALYDHSRQGGGTMILDS